MCATFVTLFIAGYVILWLLVFVLINSLCRQFVGPIVWTKPKKTIENTIRNTRFIKRADSRPSVQNPKNKRWRHESVSSLAGSSAAAQ